MNGEALEIHGFSVNLCGSAHRRTMPAMKPGVRVWCLAIAVLAAGAACNDKDKKAAAAAATPPPAPPPPKPKAPAGASCASNEDCGDGMGCSPDKTCQSYKTIECRSRDSSCKHEGRCTGSDRGCIASTNAECAAAEVCGQDGRCTAQDGKCAAVSAEDCKSLCQVQGRCSIQEGKCVAASAKDCKDSEACKMYKKCIAKKGACVKM